jgi:hypothetical protein
MLVREIFEQSEWRCSDCSFLGASSAIVLPSVLLQIVGISQLWNWHKPLEYSVNHCLCH